MTGNIERHIRGIRKKRFEFNEASVDNDHLKLDELKSQLDKISVVFHEYVSKVNPVRNSVPRPVTNPADQKSICNGARCGISNGAKEDKLKKQDSSHLLN